jgi:hypothetical protein
MKKFNNKQAKKQTNLQLLFLLMGAARVEKACAI